MESDKLVDNQSWSFANGKNSNWWNIRLLDLKESDPQKYDKYQNQLQEVKDNIKQQIWIEIIEFIDICLSENLVLFWKAKILHENDPNPTTVPFVDTDILLANDFDITDVISIKHHTLSNIYWLILSDDGRILPFRWKPDNSPDSTFDWNIEVYKDIDSHPVIDAKDIEMKDDYVLSGSFLSDTDKKWYKFVWDDIVKTLDEIYDILRADTTSPALHAMAFQLKDKQDIDYQNPKWQTALLLAALNWKEKLVKDLILIWANPWKEEENWYTAFEVAINSWFAKISALLKDYMINNASKEILTDQTKIEKFIKFKYWLSIQDIHSWRNISWTSYYAWIVQVNSNISCPFLKDKMITTFEGVKVKATKDVYIDENWDFCWKVMLVWFDDWQDFIWDTLAPAFKWSNNSFDFLKDPKTVFEIKYNVIVKDMNKLANFPWHWNIWIVFLEDWRELPYIWNSIVYEILLDDDMRKQIHGVQNLEINWQEITCSVIHQKDWFWYDAKIIKLNWEYVIKEY